MRSAGTVSSRKLLIMAMVLTMVKGLGINALDETCLLNLQPCKFILSGTLRRLFSHIGRSNLSRESLLPLQTGRQSTPIEGPDRIGHGLSLKKLQ